MAQTSVLRSRRGLVLLFMSIVFGVTPLARAQSVPRAEKPSKPPSEVPPEVRATMDFLLLAYPDLMGRPVEVSINPTSGIVAVSVTDAQPPSSRQKREEQPAAPLVTAVLTFTPTGELQSFAATGVLLEKTRNDALVQTLVAHKGWTETDADAAVEALGGKGSRSAAPVAPIDTARWSRFLGTSPQVSAPVLEWKASKTPSAAAPFKATPGWTTDVAATSSDGKAVTYRLMFEPFAGRLVMVTRQ